MQGARPEVQKAQAAKKKPVPEAPNDSGSISRALSWMRSARASGHAVKGREKAHE
jgi:hypothetical protein